MNTASSIDSSFKSRSLCAKALNKRPIGEVFHSSNEINFEDILEIMEYSRQVRQLSKPPIKRLRPSMSAPAALGSIDNEDSYTINEDIESTIKSGVTDEEDVDAFFSSSAFASALQCLSVPSPSACQPVVKPNRNEIDDIIPEIFDDFANANSAYSSTASFESVTYTSYAEDYNYTETTIEANSSFEHSCASTEVVTGIKPKNFEKRSSVINLMAHAEDDIDTTNIRVNTSKEAVDTSDDGWDHAFGLDAF